MGISDRIPPEFCPDLDISLCDLHPDNVRTKPGPLDDLMPSVQAEGVKEPISVIRSGLRFSVIKGQRRFLVSKALGLETIPALIHDAMEELQITTEQMIENIVREDMKPPDIFRGLVKLMAGGMSQVEASKKLGRSPAWVNQALSPGKLCEEALEAFMAGEFGFSQAYAITTSPDPDATFRLIMGGATTHQARKKPRPREAAVRVDSLKIPLTSGHVVTIRGDASLEEALDVLDEVKKVIKEGIKRNYTAKTLKSAAKDMAAG